ncbi:MFS transporter [Alicyclobacillus cycloheptanicus]|uniref:MFS family permease n=1 Tax=Alicyclobacillus cycloheptanicus TaxID=1457 RepID=A0ABT9XJV6_9BACL|nr:MFS transporter [Alicyclobacillus cycloheptanicus]MDQ0190324.1 MFS family permease [Alicyclobacillus cycloheptanicus]WDM00031.1 MFS transporter [Alicyclobacillus cycloheptanicus]
MFIVASLLNAVGSALLWPLITIYVHNVLHRSYGEAGFVLFCQSLASVVGQFIGGALFHRLGAKRLIVGSLLLNGFAQLSLIVAKTWDPYIAMMVANGLLNALTMPAVNAFVGFRWREQRYRLFNAIYVFNNIGVAIGTSLAGLLAALSFNLTFFFDGMTTIGFGVFFYVYLRHIGFEEADTLQVDVGMQTGDAGIGMLLRDYRLYLFIALGSMMLSIATSTWSSGVAPYLNQLGRSPAAFSFLWTANGIVILIGQPFISLLNRFITKSLYARLISSGIFYTLGFTFLWLFHGSYVLMIVSMVISTFGEMHIAPTSPALITQTTGRSAPFYLGVVGGVGNVGRLVGPLMFGNIFDFFGVVPILVIASAASLVSTVSFCVHRFLRPRSVPMRSDTSAM